MASDTDFDDFYRREYAPMVRLAYAVCGRYAVAEELAQEALLKVLTHWNRIREQDKPGAYARRVLLNTSISSLRRTRAEMRAFMRRGADDTVRVDPEIDEFWQLVRQLAPRQVQVVSLFYVEQLSTREIAEILDLGESTVRATLSHARDRLRTQLEGSER